MVAYRWKLKPFANIPGICSLRNKLPAEFLHEQKHIFPDSIDKHYLRKIDDQFQFAIAARDEQTKVFSSVTGESTFEPADQSTV